MIPETGLITKPVIPLKLPIKNPGRPPFSAPFTGWVTRPEIPLENPLKILLAPFFNPSPTC